MKSRWTKLIMLLPALVLALGITACSDDDDATGPSQTDWEVVFDAVAETWGSGTTPGAAISPTALNDDINGDAEYYILSVRAAADYNTGHIPTAVNIPWREAFTEANYATLPTDQPIAVYCYTGHTGGLVAYALQILGFDADNLKWGMMNWNSDPAVGGVEGWAGDQGLAVETGASEDWSTWPDNDLPTTVDFATDDPDEILRLAADRWISDTSWVPITSASALFNDHLSDGYQEATDPIIISVRAQADYEDGHIPGAINMSREQMADQANLMKLDPDKDIVVYCYTGHTGGQAAAILNMLGYKAQNLKFGMMDWNADYLGPAGAFSGAQEFDTSGSTLNN
ncbi:MAG: rhodanese-like domain-containing protein [bacterium]